MALQKFGAKETVLESSGCIRSFYDPRGKHTASLSSLYTTRISIKSRNIRVSTSQSNLQDIREYSQKLGETHEPH